MQRTAATAEWRKCVALGDCNRILRVTRTKTRGPPSPSALESESEAKAGNARARSRLSPAWTLGSGAGLCLDAEDGWTLDTGY